MHRFKSNIFIGILSILFIANSSSAQVSVAKIFSSNMVLQQNAEVPIWGWANSGDTIWVTGSWNQETKIAVTNEMGKWETHLSTPPASTNGEAFTVTIKGTNTITLSNVLIGEVWLLSGQSNMEMQLSGWTDSPIEGSAQAIATANFPQIRLMTVNKKSSATPESDIGNNINAKWAECTPTTSRNFSAVGFFFGRELHQKLNIPIGLVNSSWGGSSCETWAEESSLDFVSDFAKSGPWKPGDANDNQTPTVLYNGMIAPIVPFKFAGVCWYQGETNVGRSQQLTELFPSMIEGWRKVFQNKNLPFYFVQLAPWGGYGGTSLPELWEAQAFALNLHHTEMAETLDAGDEENIHPAKKEPIGFRLAQKALANVYGENSLVFAGPRYDSLKIENNKIRLFFSHTGSGLKAKDGILKQFEIAGNSNTFYSAEAEIEGNEVLVWNNSVSAPKNVRYAWDKNADASLYNNEDFPAPPFRTNPPAYINSLNSKLLIGSELIHEGENVEVKWNTIGGEEVTLNNENLGFSGSIVVSPDTTTTYTLTAKKKDDILVQTNTVFVIPKELNSWAKSKTVSASSTRTNSNAENVVDENAATSWESNFTNNEELTIDLGESIPINLVILNWTADYGRKYELQVSDDNENWTTIFQEENGNGDLDFIPELQGNGRYLRLQGIARSSSRGYNLSELKVYSTEFRKTGTLKDTNEKIMRGTPMVLGKNLENSVQFAMDITNWETIKNNGFNTVRVCWVDPWYKDHDLENWTVSEVIPYFDKCVQNAAETGMNLIINFHNVGAQQNYDTNYSFELEKEFWDSIAPRYKENELVYYEIANEPTFQIDDYKKPDFKQNLLGIYKNIRILAPERQILMFSFNSIQEGIIDIVENYKDSLDWNFTSVAYHMYGSTSGKPVKTLMAYYRVVCTEWNYNYASKQEGFEYIKQVDGFKENAQTLELLGSGWIDWRNWDDTTLNELIDTLIFDAKQKDYWWGEPVSDLKVSGVKIFPKNTELKSGKTKQLSAFVFPALAENQNISWSSSDNNIVSVNENGLITATATQNKTATITATSVEGGFKNSCQVEVLAPEKKGAYPNGIPHLVPGNINPTHYDLGGEGIGYHDENPANAGNGIRQDQGVDTEFRLEEGSVGGIQNDEWLEYTIDVQEEGNYSIAILFASPGRYGKFHIEIDEYNVTGDVYATPSGSLTIFRETKIENIFLNAGVQIMRIYFSVANFNMGSISIQKENGTNNHSIENLTDIQIFPNPFSDKINIYSEQNATNYSVQNISGQEIENGILNRHSVINTAKFQGGIYFISITGPDFSITKKILKL